MRSGSTTGRRVWMRRRVTWGSSARPSAEFLQLGGGQRQRIAAGEDQLADRVVLAQVLQRPSPLAGGGHLLAVGKVAAEAVAAVDGAAAAGDQQRAAVVLVQHALALRATSMSPTASVAKPSTSLEFGQLRQHLQQQRIVSGRLAHARHEAARNAQGEAGVVRRQCGRPGAPGPSSASNSSASVTASRHSCAPVAGRVAIGGHWGLRLSWRALERALGPVTDTSF